MVVVRNSHGTNWLRYESTLYANSFAVPAKQIRVQIDFLPKQILDHGIQCIDGTIYLRA